MEGPLSNDLNPEVIIKTLGAYRYLFNTERELQDGIGVVLENARIDFTREVELSEDDRIDFMVGSVGIEVKIKGTANALLRQLHRYAQHPEITALIVVTTRVRHFDLPKELSGKPVLTFTPLLTRAF
jgi:hypothetical protein